MQTIVPASGIVMKVLGPQKKQNTAYRFMTFCVRRRVPEGELVFHTLTRQMILLEDGQPRPEDALIAAWFLVPEGCDDKKLAAQVRSVLQVMKQKPEHIRKYTIYTTSDCNARCFYCFERGWKRTYMTQQTARRTAAFIAEHCGGKPVILAWFGGEPMMNPAAIDTICSALRDAGVEYSSIMTSNLSLFTPELAQRAAELWNLKGAQVTLDGTREVYNRAKAYVDKTMDGYMRVLENIRLLLRAGIGVSIRLNMDRYNADDLFALVEELAVQFPGEKELVIYPALLFEDVENNPKTRSFAEREALYERLFALRDRISALGYAKKIRLRRNPVLNMCKADCGEAVTVTPEGGLGLCEHCLDQNMIGRLGEPGFDKTAEAVCSERMPEIPACAQCPLYPQCIRLKICDISRNCWPGSRELTIRMLRENMATEYDAWLHPAAHDAPDESETVLEEIT